MEEKMEYLNEYYEVSKFFDENSNTDMIVKIDEKMKMITQIINNNLIQEYNNVEKFSEEMSEKIIKEEKYLSEWYNTNLNNKKTSEDLELILNSFKIKNDELGETNRDLYWSLVLMTENIKENMQDTLTKFYNHDSLKVKDIEINGFQFEIFNEITLNSYSFEFEDEKYYYPTIFDCINEMIKIVEEVSNEDF